MGQENKCKNNNWFFEQISWTGKPLSNLIKNHRTQATKFRLEREDDITPGSIKIGLYNSTVKNGHYLHSICEKMVKFLNIQPTQTDWKIHKPCIGVWD